MREEGKKVPVEYLAYRMPSVRLSWRGVGVRCLTRSMFGGRYAIRLPQFCPPSLTRRGPVVMNAYVIQPPGVQVICPPRRTVSVKNQSQRNAAKCP